jgi:hypothetical protein
MADSDYNVIKPLETVQTIPGLTPTRRRQERKRRQETPTKHHEDEPQEQPENPQDQPEQRHDDDDPHVIDYCA